MTDNAKNPTTKRRSLYIRISAALFYAVILVNGAIIIIMAINLLDVIDRADQQIYWDSATLYADRIQELTYLELEHDAVAERLKMMTALGVSGIFYLLDDQGNILMDYPPQKPGRNEKIDITPIKEAISLDAPPLPIFGDDPNSPGAVEIFSAAPLVIGGKPGFLYIVLNSNRALLFRLTGQFFLVELVLWGIAVVMVAAGILAFFLYRYLSSRFRELSNTVADFGSGNYNSRLTVGIDDEIGQLGQSFNIMADTIVHAQQTLKERDTRRRDLVADIVHDMRGPLTAMRLTLENLISDELNKETTQRLKTVYDGSVLQSNMVQDLFELSKLEAQERPANIDSIDVNSLLQRTSERLKPLAAKSGINLDYQESAERLPLVLADELLLSRAVGNLVENAIKHIPPGSTIELRCESQQNRVKITVADTGQGIEKDTVEKALTRGYSADQEQRGMGLGLAIVKRIVDLHQSALIVESTAGLGTRFCFELPIDDQ